MTMQQVLYHMSEGDPAVRVFHSHAEAVAYAREYRAARVAQPPSAVEGG